MSSIYFEDFVDRVDRGKRGDIAYIPFPFKSMSQFVAIEPRRYHVVAGESGSGKSSFVDQTYILNPIEYLMDNPDADVRFKAFVWKMERVKETVAKWTSAWLWKNYQILADYQTLLSYPDADGNPRELPDFIHEKVHESREYFDRVFEHVELHGPENPTGIKKRMRAWAQENGEMVEKDIGNGRIEKVYKPYDEKLITVVMADHMGIIPEERRSDGVFLRDRSLINKTSEFFRIMRDKFGFSPVGVMQMNRNIQDVSRRTSVELKPQRSDIEGSARPDQDSDVTIAFIDPAKYNQEKYFGYDVNKCISSIQGKTLSRFRGTHILKNSFGPSDLSFGLGFFGEIGRFTELPSSDSISDRTYRRIRKLGSNAAWNYRTDHVVSDIADKAKAQVISKEKSTGRRIVISGQN